jgi:hypothetical protein
MSFHQRLDRADEFVLAPVRPGRVLNNGLNRVQERIGFGERRRIVMG